MNWEEKQGIKVRLFYLKNPDLEDKVKKEIGDLIYRDTLELLPKRHEIENIVLKRGFRKRKGKQYDYVKYIGRNIRIHIQALGQKGNCFYHIDKH